VGKELFSEKRIRNDYQKKREWQKQYMLTAMTFAESNSLNRKRDGSTETVKNGVLAKIPSVFI
jgi:hypothetical protein